MSKLFRKSHARTSRARPRRRADDFFLQNGSKILVASYTDLRREGPESYISEFNNMVKDMWGMMGDIGVEVLPYSMCLLCMRGLIAWEESCWLE